MDIFAANHVQVTEPTPATTATATANGKLRVMFCGTHYLQYNGYSRVVYELLRRLNDKQDIELTLYGFQHTAETAQVNRQRMGPNIKVVDAFGLENPKRNGFGEQEIGKYLKENPQDIVVIYNDMSVTMMLVENILKTIGKSCRLVSYIDQVYLHQKPRYVGLLNQVFDHMIAFTDYWATIIKEHELRKDMKIDVLEHGFNHDMYFPVPRKVARAYFGFDPDTFYVLNLNRNQPRKRWDICMMAWADMIARHMKKKGAKKLRLVVGTAMQGAWDLQEVLVREIRKRKLGDPEKIMKEYLTIIDRPQQLTDTEINLLYNACDIGLNTCDGEGFGLCNFEHAAIGKPQVVPRLGGFRDFFHENNAKMVDPKFHLYIDNARDMIGGETEISDPADFADAMWAYFTNSQMVSKHGALARMEILRDYEWDLLAEHLYNIFKKIGSVPIRSVEMTPGGPVQGFGQI